MSASRSKSASAFSADTWLTDTMGVPAFKFSPNIGAEGAGAVATQMSRLADGADAFFYVKIPAADVRGSTLLVNAGFTVVDTGITFSWAGPAKPERASGIIVDVVGTGLADDSIPQIAERCFSWSRFHLDPQIAVSTANLIKRRWMESYVQGRRGAALYSARLDRTVVGFLGVLKTSTDGRDFAVIDLIGVAPEHQGRGVGPALVRSFIDDWSGRVAELRVGTQAANIRSLRFYERSGFRIIDSSYVLHAHYRRGEVSR